MILSHNQIIESVKSGSITIDPFDEESVQPASYDLRVGEAAVTTSSEGTIDVRTKGFFELGPGEFAMVLTLEKLAFDLRHCARPDMRTHYARRGIMPAAGPQVDPGFEGRLKIGLTNFSTESVRFPYGDRLMTIEIHELHEAAPEGYQGRNQGTEGFSDAEIARIAYGENTGPGGIMSKSRELSRKVSELEQQATKVSEEIGDVTKDVANSRAVHKIVRWATVLLFSATAVSVATIGLGLFAVLQILDSQKAGGATQSCCGETTNISCRLPDASPAIATEQSAEGAMNVPPTSPETPQPEQPAPTTQP